MPCSWALGTGAACFVVGILIGAALFSRTANPSAGPAAPANALAQGPNTSAPAPPVTPPAPQKPPSKLTAENYLRIKEGMQKDEAILILGPPTEDKEFGLGTYHLKWEEGEGMDKKMVIVFIRDFRVTSKLHGGLK